MSDPGPTARRRLATPRPRTSNSSPGRPGRIAGQRDPAGGGRRARRDRRRLAVDVVWLAGHPRRARRGCVGPVRRKRRPGTESVSRADGEQPPADPGGDLPRTGLRSLLTGGPYGHRHGRPRSVRPGARLGSVAGHGSPPRRRVPRSRSPGISGSSACSSRAHPPPSAPPRPDAESFVDYRAVGGAPGADRTLPSELLRRAPRAEPHQWTTPTGPR